jgi:hypothetical protein
MPRLLSAFFILAALGVTIPLRTLALEHWPQVKVLDRIVAHVEDDILFQSEMVELGSFQQFQGSPKEGDSKLLDRLIDQWIVNTEASTAHFPRPPDAEVEREIDGMKKQFKSEQAFEQHREAAGLTLAQLQHLVRQQLYLTRYIDYKFRAVVQIPRAEIEKYYRQSLAPKLEARGQPIPPIEGLEEEIRELLVVREINARADRWLEETHAHLRIERKVTPQ